MNRRLTSSKSERLKKRNDIETLFQKGKAFSVFPLKAMVLINAQQEHGIKAGFVVPKKNTALATRRNRIKRLMRETWRLHKSQLANGSAGVHLFFIFNGKKEDQNYSTILDSMQKLIAKINTSFSAAP